MNPELLAFIQESMGLTDDEVAELVRDQEELAALLDGVFEACFPVSSQ